MRIGLDAMGGDYAPKAVVEGAVAVLNELSVGSELVLFGDREQIMQHLPAEYQSRIEIVHTTEVIEMGDHPAQAFTRKADSSITVGFNYLISGRIDGFASAGSTGAMMVGCLHGAKPIQGVIRPTIATHMMTSKGTPITLLDVGLNADCKPEVLCQYGIIGSIYASEILGMENPRVALLNIGEESSKGNIVAKATYPLMANNGGTFNFVGNVEGKHIFDAEVADVIVCDGFMGNTILKVAEGMHDMFKSMVTDSEVMDSLNYETAGGTPVLGINSNVIIGHGCSSALAIKNMVLTTERTIRADVVSKFKQAFS